MLIVALSLLVAILAAFVGWRLKGSEWFASNMQRRLRQADAVDTLAALDRLPPGSLERRLLEAGLTITATQLRLTAAGLFVLATLLSWTLFIPGLPALMLGSLAAYTPFAIVNERAASRGLRIDELLPVALSRLSAGIQANHSVQAVLQRTGESLPEGHPLAAELLKTAMEVSNLGAEPALRNLALRSPSLSLSNAALLLESYARAGGSQYAEAVTEAAVQMQRVIAVRNRARSRATQAMQTAKYIPLILGGVLLMLASDPLTRQSFVTPIVQVVLALDMAIMMFGYYYLRSQVRKAV